MIKYFFLLGLFLMPACHNLDVMQYIRHSDSGNLYQSYEEDHHYGLDVAVQEMAERLIQSMKKDQKKSSPKSELQNISPLLVSSFMNVKDSYQLSSFGRVFAGLLLSEFQKRGIPVIDITNDNALFSRQKNGELILSENITDTAQKQKAKSILLGSYTVTNDSILLRGRIYRIDIPQLCVESHHRIDRTVNTDLLLEKYRVSVFEHKPRP